MWFVFERLDPMPMAALEEAADALIGYLRRLAPDLRTDLALLR
jgi:DNA/RNA-binding domain of Phe-tRNA-synthetase-like protein